MSTSASELAAASTFSTSRARRRRLVVALGSYWVLLIASLPALAGTPAVGPGFVEHQGYEQIIAGPNVPVGEGLTTNPAYVAHAVALSADGSRIWFAFFDLDNDEMGGIPEYLIYTMSTDGTGAQPVTFDATHYTGASTSSGNLAIHATADGERAVFVSFPQLSLADLPVMGDPAAELFADIPTPTRWIYDDFRVTHDGTKVLFADQRNDVVGMFDLTARGVAIAPTIIADRDALAREGSQPSQLTGFDMTADGSQWWTFANTSGVTHWLPRGTGSGPGVSTIAHEVLPLGEELESSWIEASDDGSLIAYCLDYDSTLNNPQDCWIQEPATSSWTRIEGDVGPLGEPILADGGDWLYVQDQWTSGTSYGYRISTAHPESRRVAGSQRLADATWPSFSDARMSDDGRILAAPVEDVGIYVQHDGSSPPSGFPALSVISSSYDSVDDELVVAVTVDPASPPLERIYTLPLYRGIEPDRILPEAENPLYMDRNGGGVNWSTTFDPVGGNSWERRIPLQGKLGFLTSEFAIRIVVVEEGSAGAASVTRTSYYDLVPAALFGDGFESGDVSKWSASVP